MAAPLRRRVTGLGAFASVAVWSAHFALIYASTSMLCARGIGATPWLGVAWVTWVVSAATAVALALLISLTLKAQRWLGDAFQRRVAMGTSVIAGIAILWEALPALLLPACR